MKNTIINETESLHAKQHAKKAVFYKRVIPLSATLTVIAGVIFFLFYSDVFSLKNESPFPLSTEEIMLPGSIDVDLLADRAEVLPASEQPTPEPPPEITSEPLEILSEDSVLIPTPQPTETLIDEVAEDRILILPSAEPTTVPEQKDTTTQTIRPETDTTELQVASDPLQEALPVDSFTQSDKRMHITGDTVNVRKEPSVDSVALTSLEAGDSLTQVAFGSKWSKIVLDDGTVGYILTSFLSDDPVENIEKQPATPTTSPTQPQPTSPPASTTVPTNSPKPTATTAAVTSPSTQKEDARPNESQNEEISKPAEDSKITESSISGTFYASGSVNVRSGPGTEYSIVRSLSNGEGVDVVAITSNGWYRSAKNTYVLASLLVEKKAPTPTPAPENSVNSDLAAYARSFIGVRYVFASSSPKDGFDCSGFVKYVYQNYYGISLPHQSELIRKEGVAVDSSSIQVGDIICYSYAGNSICDHVGLYIGDGKVVHASSSRGRVVETGFSMDSVISIRRITE